MISSLSIRPTLAANPPPAAPTPAPPAEDKPFGSDIRGYTGPKDGLSHPKHRWLVRSLNKALLSICYRLDVQGEEKLPLHGGQVYTPTHQSTMDALITSAIIKHPDLRSMGAISQFRGINGILMTWAGTFPVDREHPSQITKQHAVDVIKQGKGFLLFPEGGIPAIEETGRIGPLKVGSAVFAIRGNAESITPMSVFLKNNDKTRPAEVAAGIVLTAGVAALGVAAAMSGHHQILTNAATATLAGIQVCGRLARENTPKKEWDNPLPRLMATLSAAAGGGALLGGAAAAATHFFPSAAPAITWACTALGAMGTMRLALAWRNRRIAQVLISDPLKVKDYKDKPDPVIALTEDLHRALGRGKAQLSGVPYDDSAPKIKTDRSAEQRD